MQLQLIYDELAQKKVECREYLKNFKDELTVNPTYQTLINDMMELRNKKKAIEDAVAAGLGKLPELIEEAKAELVDKKEALDMAAIGQLMIGQTVEVTDRKGNVYDPIWSVRFKRRKVSGSYDKKTEAFIPNGIDI